MTGENESTEGEGISRTLSGPIEAHTGPRPALAVETGGPQPSSIDLCSRELQLTVNSEWLRPKLHALRRYLWEIRG